MLYSPPSPILHCIRLLGEKFAGQGHWVSYNFKQIIAFLFAARTELRKFEVNFKVNIKGYFINGVGILRTSDSDSRKVIGRDGRLHQ